MSRVHELTYLRDTRTVVWNNVANELRRRALFAKKKYALDRRVREPAQLYSGKHTVKLGIRKLGISTSISF